MIDAAPRIGVYGGTFNPIHLGHLRAAQEVVEALDLERMVFVPSATPPHKPHPASDSEAAGDPKSRIAPAKDRLEWVRLATADHPRFEVDDLEIERSGPSFTVDTLRALAPAPSEPLPVFTIGRDAFVELGTWREPEALLTLAHFAVTTRPPADSGCLRDWLPECLRPLLEVAGDGRSARHRSAGTWIRQLEITALDISASAIRERLRDGRSIRYLVPGSVSELIENGGYYASELPRAEAVGTG